MLILFKGMHIDMYINMSTDDKKQITAEDLPKLQEAVQGKAIALRKIRDQIAKLNESLVTAHEEFIESYATLANAKEALLTNAVQHYKGLVEGTAAESARVEVV